MASRRSTPKPPAAQPRRKRPPIDLESMPKTEMGKMFIALSEKALREGLKPLSSAEIERELNKVRYGR